MLPIDEKDYSDYIKYVSNLIGILSLFSGFMFTAYTILITRLPDPSMIMAQCTLYIVSTFLSIFLFCMSYFVVAVFYCCRNVPPSLRGSEKVSALFTASIAIAMHVTEVMMSLLWNLTLLAFIEIVQGTLLVAIGYFFMIKPFWRYRKTKRSQ